MVSILQHLFSPFISDEPYDPEKYTRPSSTNSVDNKLESLLNSVMVDTINHAPQQPPPLALSQSRAEVLQEKATLTCPTTATGEYDLACWLMGDGQHLVDQRNVNQLREFGTAVDNIMVPNANEFTNGHSMTPNYVPYEKDNYRTEILSSDRRLASGVMMNAWTGKLYELFEEDLPPPNTDKSIPRERFTMTNPRLIQMSGGIDPNLKLPTKKEIAQQIPGSDYGTNPWGDALYADRRRQELQQRTMRDVFNNRNGDFSIQSVDDRKPVGYMGYVPMYRPVPYLPPTQRTSMDNAGWMGIPAAQVPFGPDLDEVMPEMTSQREETLCTRVPYPNQINGVEGGAIGGEYGLTYNNRQTTAANPVVNARGDGGSTYVVSDQDILPTQKTLMQQSFANGQANWTEAPYTERSALETWTQRGAGEELFVEGANGEYAGEYVVADQDILPTQKSLMQEAFPTVSNGGQAAVGDQLAYQGPLNNTRRQYYSDQVVTSQAAGDWGIGYPQETVYHNIIQENRGLSFADQWISETHVPSDNGGTSTRVFGYNDRDTQGEFENRMPMPDRPSLQEPRVLPVYTYCPNEVYEEGDYDPQWINPTYMGEVAAWG